MDKKIQNSKGNTFLPQSNNQAPINRRENFNNSNLGKMYL
jgi:hypothetical protein